MPPNGEYRGKINENDCLIKVFNLSKTDKRVYAYLDSILSIDLDSVITLEFE